MTYRFPNSGAVKKSHPTQNISLKLSGRETNRNRGAFLARAVSGVAAVAMDIRRGADTENFWLSLDKESGRVMRFHETESFFEQHQNFRT